MLCYILDDRVGKTMYEDLSAMYPDWEFPITKDVRSPLDYFDEVVEAQPDYVLLDNYFPHPDGPGVASLGAEFMEKLIKKYGVDGEGFDGKVICISNNGKMLLSKSKAWKEGYENGFVIGFAPGKSAEEVQEIVEDQ